MMSARYEHTATLLPNGEVLVTGGIDNGGHVLATAELYNPQTDTWSSAGSMAFARNSHTATLLPNGQVLVTGGGFSTSPLSSAELYSPTCPSGKPA